MDIKKIIILSVLAVMLLACIGTASADFFLTSDSDGNEIVEQLTDQIIEIGGIKFNIPIDYKQTNNESNMGAEVVTFSDGNNKIIVSVVDTDDSQPLSLDDDEHTKKTIAGKEGYISEDKENNCKIFSYDEGSKVVMVAVPDESILEGILSGY